MVKTLLLAFLLTLTLHAAEDQNSTIELTQKERLDQKIESFIGEKHFSENQNYINIIFKGEKRFFNNDKLRVVDVIEVLEDNGLLKLMFEVPTRYEMTFRSTGEPLFFVKLMGDSLRDMGYYRYVIKESSQDATGFSWTISLEAEYMTDPVLLQKELQKRGCNIIDIVHEEKLAWSYEIDTSKAFLNVETLKNGEKRRYTRVNYAKWLDVAKIKSLYIKSHRANEWYPYIALYDSSLRLLKVIKQDKFTESLDITLPLEARYARISDLYTVTNIKNGLDIKAYGKR